MAVMIFGYAVQVWEVLAVIGLALCALEIVVPGFVLLPIGLAFLATSAFAMFVSSWLIVFLVLGVNLFLLVWFFAKKVKSKASKPVLETNVQALVGKEVVVADSINKGELGQVKIYGEVWTAYSLNGKSYTAGTRTLIVKIDGNKIALD